MLDCSNRTLGHCPYRTTNSLASSVRENGIRGFVIVCGLIILSFPLFGIKFGGVSDQTSILFWGATLVAVIAAFRPQLVRRHLVLYSPRSGARWWRFTFLGLECYTEVLANPELMVIEWVQEELPETPFSVSELYNGYFPEAFQARANRAIEAMALALLGLTIRGHIRLLRLEKYSSYFGLHLSQSDETPILIVKENKSLPPDSIGWLETSLLSNIDKALYPSAIYDTVYTLVGGPKNDPYEWLFKKVMRDASDHGIGTITKTWFLEERFESYPSFTEPLKRQRQLAYDSAWSNEFLNSMKSQIKKALEARIADSE